MQVIYNRKLVFPMPEHVIKIDSNKACAFGLLTNRFTVYGNAERDNTV